MADTRPGSEAKTMRKRGSSLSIDVIGAVDDLVAAAKSPAGPVPKKARRKIQKLGRKLDAVRATEAKRLRQSAKARQEADRRDLQAAAAAAQMASIVSTIRDTAAGSIAKRSAGAATRTKPTAAKPAAAPDPSGATKAATTAKAATRRRTTATQPAKPARGARPTTTRRAKPKPKPTA